MNKQELINRICKLSDMKKRDAHEFLTLLEKVISEEIHEGNHICLQNFGTFSPWPQAARAGRNPRTGISCPIPPRLSIKFKPGKRLARELNK